MNMSIPSNATVIELDLLDQMDQIVLQMKNTFQQSVLFQYPSKAPEKYVQDFYTRLAHDLIRSQGHFERYPCRKLIYCM